MPQDPAHDLILTRMDASSTAALDREPDSHTAPHHTMSKQAWVLSKAGKPLEEKADRSEHNNQPARRQKLRPRNMESMRTACPKIWNACTSMPKQEMPRTPDREALSRVPRCRSDHDVAPLRGWWAILFFLGCFCWLGGGCFWLELLVLVLGCCGDVALMIGLPITAWKASSIE